MTKSSIISLVIQGFCYLCGCYIGKVDDDVGFWFDRLNKKAAPIFLLILSSVVTISNLTQNFDCCAATRKGCLETRDGKPWLAFRSDTERCYHDTLFCIKQSQRSREFSFQDSMPLDMIVHVILAAIPFVLWWWVSRNYDKEYQAKLSELKKKKGGVSDSFIKELADVFESWTHKEKKTLLNRFIIVRFVNLIIAWIQVIWLHDWLNVPPGWEVHASVDIHSLLSVGSAKTDIFPSWAYCEYPIKKLRTRYPRNTTQIRCFMDHNWIHEILCYILSAYFWTSTIISTIYLIWTTTHWKIKGCREKWAKNCLSEKSNNHKSSDPVEHKFLDEYIGKDGLLMLDLVKAYGGESTAKKTLRKCFERYQLKKSVVSDLVQASMLASTILDQASKPPPVKEVQAIEMNSQQTGSSEKTKRDGFFKRILSKFK